MFVPTAHPVPHPVIKVIYDLTRVYPDATIEDYREVSQIRLTFPSGITLSCGYGRSHYCGKDTVECAAWYPTEDARDWIDLGNPTDDVIGYQSVDDVKRHAKRLSTMIV
jgi:hypothetical protein